MNDHYIKAAISIYNKDSFGFKGTVEPWDEDNWKQFLEFLKANNILPILHSYSEETSCTIIPDIYKDAAQKSYSRTKMKNVLHSNSFDALSKDLNNAGIEVIALKSICLSEILYRDIGLRPYADIDLLLKKSDIPGLIDISKVIELKVPRGKDLKWFLTNHYEIPGLHKNNEFSKMDIHWNFSLERRHCVDTEELWKHKKSFQMGNSSAFMLSNEHMVIHLATHIGYHYYSMKLAGIFDFYKFCTEMDIDWIKVGVLIRKWRLESLCYFSFVLLERFFNVDLVSEKNLQLRIGHLRKSYASLIKASGRYELFRKPGKRLNQLQIAFLTIDRPADQISFTAGKIFRRIIYGGERWPCDLT